MLIKIKDLTVSYGTALPIIKNLSFELNHGETLGLCGSSGCGKTTVIWTILGMLKYYGGNAQGEIAYQGFNLLELTEVQWKPLRWRKIALVPQSSMSALNPVFTIKRSFMETLKVHGELKKDSKRRISSLIELVGLTERVLSSYPHELSGGMMQRVSIALALLLNPEILILDEATTGLDVIVEADILKLLLDIQYKRKLSMLFVSHDRRITEGFCHRRLAL